MNKTEGEDEDNNDFKGFVFYADDPNFRSIDDHLDDSSIIIYQAKSKEDVLQHFMDTRDLETLSYILPDGGYYNNSEDEPSLYPSPMHLVVCDDQHCPCSNYIKCQVCKKPKEALPSDDCLVISHNMSIGKVEEFLKTPADEDTTSSPTTSCCQCAEPKFLTKLEMCLEGIQHNMYENHSDFSVDLVQVDVVERQQPTIVRLLRANDNSVSATTTEQSTLGIADTGY